jgi:two-component system, chemotaxis family, response regulator Rcp1
VTELHIMLIDDSRADAKIVERALREGTVPHRLTVIPDGRQALDYLFGLLDEPADPARQPDLILLDLNLPGLNGHQVLDRIKSDPRLRILPVIVLTTSSREEDVVETYRAGANTYIPKPPEYAGYCSVISAVRTYWLDTALKVPHALHRANAAAGGPTVSPG